MTPQETRIPLPRDGDPPAAPADASRRTHLANERTYLAWLRTGLTAFAVAIAVGQLVPALTDRSAAPYVVAGIGFAALGIAFVLYGLWRIVAVRMALEAGHYRAPGSIVLMVMSLLAVALGSGLIALLVVGS